MSTKVTVVTNTASSNYTLTNGGETTGAFTLAQGARGPAGINWITSTTAPTDTTSGWLDPESGITAVYIGGGWVTQLESSGVPDGAYVNGSGAYYINGSGAFYISI